MKLQMRPFYVFYMMQWSLLSSLVAIEDFLGQKQQILWGAGVVRAPSHFWSYPTSMSHTLYLVFCVDAYDDVDMPLLSMPHLHFQLSASAIPIHSMSCRGTWMKRMQPHFAVHDTRRFGGFLTLLGAMGAVRLNPHAKCKKNGSFVRSFVRPSVCPSVRLSVRSSVRPLGCWR